MNEGTSRKTGTTLGSRGGETQVDSIFLPLKMSEFWKIQLLIIQK